MILHNWHMHVVNKSFGKKKLEDCDENPNYTYFEKWYGQTFPPDVCFPTNDISVHATNMCYSERCSSASRIGCCQFCHSIHRWKWTYRITLCPNFMHNSRFHSKLSSKYHRYAIKKKWDITPLVYDAPIQRYSTSNIIRALIRLVEHAQE